MGNYASAPFNYVAGSGVDDSQRILIVDDEPRMGDSLRTLLEGEARELAVCSSGTQAIDILDRFDIDLILLDLGMPDVSGMDVLDWISKNQISATVIIVSANDSIDSVISALRSRAYDFVRKPYQAEHIQRTVENALHRRRLERSHALITARLEQSERLHRFLVENSPDIIYTLDTAGRFTFVNGRVEELLGFSRKDLIGEHYASLVHEEDREQARYAFQERRTGHRATNNVELRLSCKLGDSDFRNFENRFVVIVLSAMGVYEEGDGSNKNGFLGTYGVARDITERKRAEETISFQAYHDLLTQLPNRTLFKDRLGLAMAQSRRHGRQVGVMFIDLDRFKLVNDTYGHAGGDELLKGVATRLKHCVRSGDTLARQGGDEFTVMLPDLAAPEDAAAIAEKIVEELRRPFTIADQEFRATVSIGIAIFPRDGDTEDALIKHADIAMYHVKARGKNGYQYFTAAMNEMFLQRLSLENDLRNALQRSEFELHYQPQVSISRGKVVGVEALIRWRHPDHGLLNPTRFIDLAEETGLISAISDWVLDTACGQLRTWREAGMDGLRMSVNLSPHEFERGDVVRRVAGAAALHRLPANVLEVEITENLLLQDAEGIIDKVRRLREHGVRVSIDDFGTRYSSLNYLQKFPISSIKIDQSFIKELDNRSEPSPVIVAIVAIARGFGLHLLAEGVETIEQVEALRGLGCDEMQGYFFGHPMRADQATEALRAPVRSLSNTSGATPQR